VAAPAKDHHTTQQAGICRRRKSGRLIQNDTHKKRNSTENADRVKLENKGKGSEKLARENEEKRGKFGRKKDATNGRQISQQ
jgi:hypothetical protein